MSRFLPFHTFRRKNSKGKPIYYVRFLDPDTGKTVCTRSSGLGNKTAAIRWAESKLPEIEEERAHSDQDQIPTLSGYAQSYFTDDGPYATRRTERGYGVAKVYLYTCRCYTKNHVIPTWGHFRLNELTSEIIDRDVIQIFQSGKVASDTANKILRVLRLILDGAVTDGYLIENPASRVKQVKVTKKERGVFTRPELVSIFQDPMIWTDSRHYTLNLLAFTTGIRLGEIRGLCLENVHDDYISVRLQWEDRFGLKPPKADSIRDIPIPPITAESLRNLISLTVPHRIVFYSLEDKGKPMTKSHIEKSMYKTLHTIGINEKDRRRRNLVFHSWRHTLNTVMRSDGIADAKILQITGHRTEEMTSNYTHFQADDFRDVSSLTDRLLVGSER